MNQPRFPRALILGLGIFLVLIAVGSNASAQEADLITACVTSRGSITIVEASEVCAKNETRLVWGITGRQGPEAETASAGPQPREATAGNLSLAGKGCPAGRFVTGFAADGDLVCSEAVPAAPPPTMDADALPGMLHCIDGFPVCLPY